MARRTIYVGGLAELEAIKPQYANRLFPQSDYVFGRHCDATPEAGLMWLDLASCFRKAKLTSKQRYAYTESLKLVPIAEIARQMGVTDSTVCEHLREAEKKLENLSECLGCLTVVLEECGGWGQLRHYVADLFG